MKKTKLFLLLIVVISTISSCEKDAIPVYKPPTSTVLIAKALSATSVQITWEGSSECDLCKEMSRVLTRKGPNDINFVWVSDNLNPSVKEFKDTIGLVGGTTYTYRLIGFFNAVQSQPNDVIVTTLPAAAILPNVTIGTQLWALKNLDIATYRNGDPIPQATDINQFVDSKTGIWCYLNFDSTNGPIYGKLYNKFAVDDIRGLAPLGWRIPSSNDWYTLRESQGGSKVAGDKLKSTNSLWTVSTYSIPSNTSGFTALPGGRLLKGSYQNAGGESRFWTSTDSAYSSNGSTIQAKLNIFLFNGTSEFYTSQTSEAVGFSVRLIKN